MRTEEIKKRRKKVIGKSAGKVKDVL